MSEVGRLKHVHILQVKPSLNPSKMLENLAYLAFSLESSRMQT